MNTNENLRAIVQAADERIQGIVRAIEANPILYFDTIRGRQLCRDDMWAVSTNQLIDLRHALREVLSSTRE